MRDITNVFQAISFAPDHTDTAFQKISVFVLRGTKSEMYTTMTKPLVLYGSEM
jgi:hypothetical protein